MGMHPFVNAAAVEKLRFLAKDWVLTHFLHIAL
jgi:hypothetical protein